MASLSLALIAIRKLVFCLVTMGPIAHTGAVVQTNSLSKPYDKTQDLVFCLRRKIKKMATIDFNFARLFNLELHALEFLTEMEDAHTFQILRLGCASFRPTEHRKGH
jgi:hypothetical protein